ncbi:MAG: 23S rRNA (pseudouridine(1915)-N(3))-methyltransferase RlmH [Chlamydiia bacterium]|nr:23S rRNA (pseudouridine(1915)-N(3))-methyltransferase RlmH [Chlamydiia bacterium]
MGLKIKIFSPGKTKEKWLQEGLAEYEKRLGGIEIEWDYKTLPQKAPFICLDPRGKSYSSTTFSEFLYKEFEKEGSRLTFVIGDADGLPSHLLEKASHVITLSKLTFTHQLARLILLEQIYRATQIYHNTPYHK